MKRKNYPLEEQRVMVQRNPHSIMYITNLEKDVVKTSLKMDPFFIEACMILDPEYYKQFIDYAVLCDNGVLGVVDSDLVSEEVLLKVVENNGWYLKHIKRQGKKIVRAAVKSNPFSIKFVKDLSYVDELIQINPKIVQHIHTKLTEDQCIEGAKLDDQIARFIMSVSGHLVAKNYVLNSNKGQIATLGAGFIQI